MLVMEHFLSSTRIFRISRIFATGLFTSLAIMPALAFAKSGPHTEIRVNLLGQTCLLEGPFDESTLKFVHSIGPAQIYPSVSISDLSTALKQTNHALDTLRSSNRLPSLLDRYRKKLGKRFESQIAFFGSLNGNKEATTSLIKLGKTSLKGKDLKTFESLAKNLYTPEGKRDPHYTETSDQLFEIYNESIERDPEEDFHRAIKKLDIHYVCSFEEQDGHND